MDSKFILLVQNIEICAGYPFRSGELVDILKLESENEHSSGENIYPEFADIADEEGYKDVAQLFRLIADVEKGHEKILIQLHEELKGKTTRSSIAHRLNILKHCDKIIYMDEGKIIDINSFKALSDKYQEFKKIIELSKIELN